MQPSRRKFVRFASGITAGIILSGRKAFGEETEEIRIHNDYTSSVSIELYHPFSLDSPTARWSFESGEESRLLFEDEVLYVKSDWGIRVLFDNGASSAVMRLRDVGFPSVITASHIYDNPDAAYPDGREITKIAGYDIDSNFGEAETAILRSALGLFYERFLQPYTAGCPEICTRAAYRLEDEFPTGDFTDSDGEEVDVRDIIEIQRSRLSYNYVVLENPFPEVKLEYAYDEEENFVAKAPVGVVRVRPRGEDDDATGPYPVEGSFLIKVNDYYVKPSDSKFGNPAYWAGVLAHEAMHNLGHRHPGARDEDNYYLHQMILVEHMVMKKGKVRYGDENETPVLCRPWG